MQNKYNVVFWGLKKTNKNGIKYARKIREYSSDVLLFFVADCMDYALEGYRLDVVRYILNSDTLFEHEIDECIGIVINKLQDAPVGKIFTFVEGKKYISLNEIVYIESNLHKVKFFIQEKTLKTYTMYTTLNKIERSFSKYSFLRIHQSFLVNAAYITNLFRYKIILKNGIVLPVSKKRFRMTEEHVVMSGKEKL